MDKYKLQYEIKSRGMTTQEFCEKLGMGLCTFSKKCNGKSEFTLSEIKSIVKILKLESPMDIFFADQVS